MKEHMINKTKQEFKNRIKKIYTHRQIKIIIVIIKTNLKSTEV
jgi:hypothetical protein